MKAQVIFAATLLVALSVNSPGQAQHFQVDCTMFRGDPQGSRAAGTLHLCAAPTLKMKSGEEGQLLVGGSIIIGKQAVPVGRQVSITATDVKDGAIKVDAVFEHIQAVGPVGAQQVSSTRIDTTATVQSGGQIRLELGKDPKDRQWVVITVRKVK